MRIDEDNLIFDNGKIVYAYNGIVGISPEGGLSEGYDGDFSGDRLTIGEKIELADYMIILWTSYLNEHKGLLLSGGIAFDGKSDVIPFTKEAIDIKQYYDRTKRRMKGLKKEG